MTVKLLLLKSGEDVIADVSEMTVGDKENPRVVGYFLDNPCVIKMNKPTLLTEDETVINQKAGVQVSLFPWIPLSKDKRIPITAEWIITITEPVDNLKEMYIKDVMNDGKTDQDTSAAEQSDSDKSN